MNKPLLFLTLVLILSIPKAFSQSPQSFKYQAVVRDASNAPLTNQAVSVQMSILEGSANGSPIYTETHQLTTDKLGLISLNIGNGTPVAGDFMTIAWGRNNYFLQIEIDESGGANYKLLGASQLMSVPYSLYADKAGSIDNLSLGLNDLNDIDAATPDSGNVLTWDGTKWVSRTFASASDADRDSTNELQTLNLTGNILNISDGNSVALPFPFNGGAGITVTTSPTGSIITNTGDTNANDDITTSSIAGGDLSGTFDNMSINKIRGQNVADSVPSIDDILKWNGTAWAPASDDVASGPGAVNTTGRISGDGANTPLDIAQQGAGVNQVLKWNGTSWAPNVDENTTYDPGVGIVISNDSIINTGDVDASDDITISSFASGDVSGNFSNMSVDKIKGNEVSPAAPIFGQVYKWNGTEWSPSADNNTTYDAGAGIVISSDSIINTGDIDASDDITISSFASGDVSGNFSALSVDKIKGNTVSATPPAVDQVLKWDGAAWTPVVDENTTYDSGAGIVISNDSIINTGDIDASDDITISSFASGDVSGNFAALSVDKIKGNAVAITAPAVGQVLKWNGTEWAPVADENTTYAAGSGIDITGTVVSNTGDTDASDDITTASVAAGDVSGNFAALSVDKIKGNAVAITAPAVGQVLKWNGTEWAPVADENTTYAAGSGIDITGTVVSNTGDTDASDDITTASVAAGDVSGNFAALSVDKIKGNAVAITAPAVGQVLKWNGTEWAPVPDENTTYVAGSGIDITGTVVSNTGDTDASDDITTASVAAGDVSGNFSALSVDKIKGNAVAVTAPALGQVLKWNGTEWAPVPDENTTYAAGSGIDITGTVVSNTGDTDASDDITTASVAAGDVSGNFSALSVDKIKGNAVAVTAPAVGQVLKWNGTEWAPVADENTTYAAGSGIDITGTIVSNTGDTDASDDITTASVATGDVSGNFSALSVDKIKGNAVAVTAPALGQVLKWNGTEWAPVADENTTYAAGSGIDITGTVVSNTGDTDASDDITTASVAAGDVSGNFSALSVDKIKGNAVAVTAPALGQVLKWNGTEWAPVADENTTYAAGSGIDITGTVVSNTGDTDASDDITTASVAAGDVSGNFSALSVDKIKGNAVAVTAPALGQVLKWNGTEWAPVADENTTYAAGSGIDITGTIVSNTGDTDASDDITTSSIAGGDVSGIFSALSVDNIKGNPVSATAPDSFQVLKWNGSEWAPDFDEEGIFIWDLNDTTAFYDAGNVAIGSTTSTHQLQISGDNNALRLVGTESSSGEGAKINFGDGNFVYLKEWRDDEFEVNSEYGIWLNTNTLSIGPDTPMVGSLLAVQGDLLTVDADGNTGIGHNDPLTRLNVRSKTSDSVVFRTEKHDGSFLFGVDSAGYSGFGLIHDSVTLNLLGDTSDYLIFCIENDTAALYKFYPDGYVWSNGNMDVVGNLFGKSLQGHTLHIFTDSLGLSGDLINATNFSGDPKFMVDTAGNALVTRNMGVGELDTSFALNLRTDPFDSHIIWGENSDGVPQFYVDTAGFVYNDGSALTTGNMGIGAISSLSALNVTAAASNRDIFLGWNSTGSVKFEIDTAGTVKVDGNIELGVDPTSTTHKLQIEEDTMAVRLVGTLGTWKYGSQINFGDANYVHLKEYKDDDLQIHAKDGIWMDAPYIGIGTDSYPLDAKLAVDGNIRVSDDGDIFGLDQIVGFNDLRIYGGPGGAPDLYIDTDGNAGFGAAYSDTRLNVRTKSSDEYAFFVEKYDTTALFLVDSAGNAEAEKDITAKGNMFVFGIWEFGGDGLTWGDLDVVGTLSKGAGSFKIDHPLDPANKYLYHSFVESPDMMNVYNGNIITDAQGFATVTLPDYFMTLNKDFRYQLTVIGTFAQAIVKEKISNNRFVIQTNQPNVEVSWQVTGIRQDKFAEKNRIVPEVDKAPEDRGYYLHPELYDMPISKRVGNSSRKTSERSPRTKITTESVSDNWDTERPKTESKTKDSIEN